jgi:hypothetical protein
MICDFCTAPDPSWRFEARAFAIDYGELVGHSDEGWAACDECCRLILAGDRSGLVERAMQIAPSLPDLPRETEREMRIWAQGLFFKHRTNTAPTLIGAGVPG